MKTICPNCKKPIEIPDVYEGHEVKDGNKNNFLKGVYMKRIILLLGLLASIAIPALLIGQDEPNRPSPTKTDLVEPNRPSSAKTDLKVLVFRLKNEVDQLQKQARILLADNLKNKNAIENFKTTISNHDKRIDDLERIIRERGSKPSSKPNTHRRSTVPKK